VLRKINLQVKTDLAVAQQVLSWFDELNQPPIPDKEIWYKCQTLLWEGFANIAEHAHKGLPPETLIEIEAVRFEQQIEIRIWDYGSPFDLEKKLQEIPDFEENDDDRGRGLKIISLWADRFSYTRLDDERNCLFILKFY
jgi:serine/threonine-protein kinase RsbW